VGLTTLHIPFESQGLTRQGANLLHNGEVVAVLRRPWVRDASGIDLGPDQEERYLDVQFGQGEIILTLDDTGLVYPITIDPPLDLQPGASEDDASLTVANSSTAPHTFTSIFLTSAQFGAGEYGTTRYGAGARFVVPVDNGVTIDVAYLTLTCGNTGVSSGTVIRTNIYVEDTDDAAVYSTVANYNGRAKMAAVAWDGMGAWILDTEYNSSSLVTPIQSRVNEAGWASGQAMGVKWEDRDSDDEAFRYTYSWDDNAAKAAKLHIEYTVAGSGASWGGGVGAALIGKPKTL